MAARRAGEGENNWMSSDAPISKFKVCSCVEGSWESPCTFSRICKLIQLLPAVGFLDLGWFSLILSWDFQSSSSLPSYLELGEGACGVSSHPFLLPSQIEIRKSQARFPSTPVVELEKYPFGDNYLFGYHVCPGGKLLVELERNQLVRRDMGDKLLGIRRLGTALQVECR
uniref:Uncharacterized protein n=1 Tax=Ananas comosus var. bracteatus TaxID=296719 RepID=A0A6V7Q0F8_ANACO|nr:unnamed protein product [Ananas comosus var. bracteatus]